MRDFLKKVTVKIIFLIGLLVFIAPSLQASRLRPSDKTEGSLPLQRRRKEIKRRLPGEQFNDELSKQQFQEMLLAEESKNKEDRALQHIPGREERGAVELSEGAHLAPDSRYTQ